MTVAVHGTVPVGLTIVTEPAARTEHLRPTHVALMHGEFGDGSRRRDVIFGAGKRRANEGAMEGPAFVNRWCRGGRGWCRWREWRRWLGIRCRRLDRLSDTGKRGCDHSTRRRVGEHLIVKDRGRVFLFSDRDFATFEDVFSLAGIAASLLDFVSDNGHYGVVG